MHVPGTRVSRHRGGVASSGRFSLRRIRWKEAMITVFTLGRTRTYVVASLQSVVVPSSMRTGGVVCLRPSLLPPSLPPAGSVTRLLYELRFLRRRPDPLSPSHTHPAASLSLCRLASFAFPPPCLPLSSAPITIIASLAISASHRTASHRTAPHCHSIVPSFPALRLLPSLPSSYLHNFYCAISHQPSSTPRTTAG